MWRHLLTKFASYKVPPVMVSTHQALAGSRMVEPMGPLCLWQCFDINFILQQTVHSGAVHSDGTRKIHLQKENVFKIFFPGAFGKVGRVRHSSPFNDKISIQRSVKRCLHKEILQICFRFFLQLFLKFKVSGSRDFHFTHVYPMP